VERALGQGEAFSPAVSDAVQPRDRAQAVGIYRFWRDTGFVAGGLTAGFVADLASSGGAIALVAALTAASGVLVAITPLAAAASSRCRTGLTCWTARSSRRMMRACPSAPSGARSTSC
jgi:hypothetical protein